MKSRVEKLYFFAVICAKRLCSALVFGGHATLNAGASAIGVLKRKFGSCPLRDKHSHRPLNLVLSFPRTSQIILMLARLILLLALYLLVAFRSFGAPTGRRRFALAYICSYT